MSNVIKFSKPDFLSYITNEDGAPVGVKAKGLSISQHRNFACVSTWDAPMGNSLTVYEFNQVCIAWLALHNPDVLKCDRE
jgi:hypothetical protein